MVGTWLGEIRSCSCLAVLPDSAWVLLNKIYQPFFTSLYVHSYLVVIINIGADMVCAGGVHMNPYLYIMSFN